MHSSQSRCGVFLNARACAREINCTGGSGRSAYMHQLSLIILAIDFIISCDAA